MVRLPHADGLPRVSAAEAERDADLSRAALGVETLDVWLYHRTTRPCRPRPD